MCVFWNYTKRKIRNQYIKNNNAIADLNIKYLANIQIFKEIKDILIT